jgi:hypothetical protein
MTDVPLHDGSHDSESPTELCVAKVNGIPGNVMVKVTGVVERVNGNRLALKTDVEGVKLELTIERLPNGIAAGSTVEMSQYSHVDSFNNGMIALKSETVKKIMVIGK